MSDQASYPVHSTFVIAHDAENVAKVIMQGPATDAKRPGTGAAHLVH